MECAQAAADALNRAKGWLEERARDGSRCTSPAQSMLVFDSHPSATES